MSQRGLCLESEPFNEEHDEQIGRLEVWPIISRQSGTESPHEDYWFHDEVNPLQPVTGDGRWKLQLPQTYRTMTAQKIGRDGEPGNYVNRQIKTVELYALVNDIGETTDASAEHPEILRQLEAEVETARTELADWLTKRPGSAPREPGRVN